MKGIIVLGSRIPENSLHEELKQRLDVALELYDQKSVLILSGGITNHDAGKSEARFMADYCLAKGIPENRIHLEEQSLDTIGNGYFTRIVADNIPGLSEIHVVSSCYHMKRVEYIFSYCFGEKYSLDFSHCCPFTRPKDNEKDSMEMAISFFDGLEKGDIAAVGNRLFGVHLMYKNGT